MIDNKTINTVGGKINKNNFFALAMNGPPKVATKYGHF
jgi:hypothetical protein